MLTSTIIQRLINKRTVISTSSIALSALISACNTLPTTASYGTGSYNKVANNTITDNEATNTTAANTTAINPLTAAMPAMDRQGRIAYVEEQNAGSAKISSLYTLRPDGSDKRLIDQLNGYIYAPSWSADGKFLAYSKQAMRQNPKIYIYDVDNQTYNVVVNTAGSNLSPSFSPDGQKLLYSSTIGGNADIYELRLDNGQTRQLTTLPSTEVQPSYASDGQSFVYTSDKKNAGRPRIYRYNFATSSATQISNGDYAASPQLSLNGQRLAYLNGRQAAIMTLATGQIVKLAETGLDEPARFSPSGQYALYPTRTSQLSGQNGGSLVVRSLVGGSSYAISSEAGGTVRSPIWGR